MNGDRSKLMAMVKVAENPSDKKGRRRFNYSFTII